MNLCLGRNYSTKQYNFVSVDLNGTPDIIDDIFKLDKIEAGSCQIIIASHVLEHGYYYGDGPYKIKGVIEVLKLWGSKLVNGGKIFIAVPNFDFIVDQYLKNRKRYFWNQPDILGCMLGSFHDTQKHNMVFNFECLLYCLMEAGFNEVEELLLGDSNFLPHVNSACTDIRSLNVGAIKDV